MRILNLPQDPNKPMKKKSRRKKDEKKVPNPRFCGASAPTCQPLAGRYIYYVCRLLLLNARLRVSSLQ